MASAQSPITQSVNTYSYSNTRIQYSRQDHDEATIYAARQQRKDLVVVPLEHFFDSVFPNVKLDKREEKRIERKRTALSYIKTVLAGGSNDEAAKADVMKKDTETGTKADEDTTKKVKAEEKAREIALSTAVVKGINECCPPISNGQQLRYFDTHELQGKAVELVPGVAKMEAPDGILTWKWTESDPDHTSTKKGRFRDFLTCIPPIETEGGDEGEDEEDNDGDDPKDLNYYPDQEPALAQRGPRTQMSYKISIEKKWLLTPVSQNPGILFEHKFSSSADIQDKVDQSWTNDQLDLFVQTYGYTVSQWSSIEPYRFLIGVTLTGEFMRFWVYGPSGIRASTAFRYMEDVRPLSKLFHLYQKSNFGYDVGPDALFQPIPNESVTA
ncbi:hypothetical protein FRC17_005854, partial [Serendipita sp. 399]